MTTSILISELRTDHLTCLMSLNISIVNVRPDQEYWLYVELNDPDNKLNSFWRQFPDDLYAMEEEFGN